MGKKQTKSDKRYKKNKTLVKAKIKVQKVGQQKYIRETIRNEKLKKEDLSDSEREEEQLDQHYLKISTKNKDSSKKEKKNESGYVFLYDVEY